MTSYAILGAGALGGLYGGLLASIGGADVHFLLHSDYEHVREQACGSIRHWAIFICAGQCLLRA